MHQPPIQQQVQPQIGFADTQIVFPPPENWTETQYAIYEEPMSSEWKDGSGSEGQGVGSTAFRAITVRDSTELRMQNTRISRGEPVIIIEQIPKHQVCKVNYQGQIGLYKLRDFVKDEKQRRHQKAADQRPQNNPSQAYNDQLQIVIRGSDDRQPTANQSSAHKGSNIQSSSQASASKRMIKAVNKDSMKRQSQINVAAIQDGDSRASDRELVSIEVSNAKGSFDGHSPMLKISSNNQSSMMNNSNRISQSHRGQKTQGAVQNQTIEQMSPINAVEDGLDLSGTQRNFFREDPEKNFSKQMRNYTPQQVADASRRALQEDRDEHKQKNLKLVERQKRKAQLARKATGREGAPK